ncbi:MAG TPA: hypothetical protein VN670_05180 [Acidobacteriaceae bacterium]|nr:hypothetical protein [Acidobacteriaceae bacterium]
MFSQINILNQQNFDHNIDTALIYFPFHVRSQEELENKDAVPDAPRHISSDDLATTKQKYHWKGLIWQSLELNSIESVFRLADDDQIQTLLFNKPYWHDYIASLHQFNMGRWNDGDDFLINYVGHPMQGAVSGYIEIQNDPTGSRLEISRSSAYLKSRWYALLWSAAYSTQSEIGPFGEAALGNEGGWTYPLGCKRPCPEYQPGVTKYTNNTGWVDFIITPVVGELWIITEDTLDRYVSDRVQGDDRTRLFPKILRGSLNPSRTMANFLRWKNPWYRDWQHSAEAWNRAGDGIHFTPSDEQMQEMQNRPRWEIEPHFTAFSVAVNTPTCTNCRRVTSGVGAEFSYRLYRWLDADVDTTVQPNASPAPSDRAGGTLVSGVFGLRTGLDTENYALKLALRPGFVSFDNAYETSPNTDIPVPQQGQITHFTWNVAVSGDYRLSRHFAWRAELQNSVIRYRSAYVDPPGIGTPPYLSWLSHEYFVNRGNWVYQSGPVFRF